MAPEELQEKICQQIKAAETSNPKLDFDFDLYFEVCRSESVQAIAVVGTSEPAQTLLEHVVAEPVLLLLVGTMFGVALCALFAK